MSEKELPRKTVKKAFKEILTGYNLSENLKFLLFSMVNWIVTKYFSGV
jgi:hypothetical protein